MLAKDIPFTDWAIVIGYVIMTLILGLIFTRRASKNTEEFFVSGRNLPWWLAGTSIVATTFASDTPLWVTDMVRSFGIHMLWYEWAPAWGTVITIFITGRLIRRSGLVTDIQLTQNRYGGQPGAILRIFQGAYFSLFFNTIVLGWVLAAMGKWSVEVIGVNKYTAVISCAAVALIYSVFSGLWGVVVTDLFQFIVATIGAIVLAAISVHEVGGISGMVTKLGALSDWQGHELNIFPHIGTQMSLSLIITYFGIQWIFGANPALYSSQRILACKSDRDASLALIWNTLARHGLNIWPWIIVALCSLIIFPGLEDHQQAYPRMVATLLPTGLRGLMFAAVLAAFMSSVDTLFNWGSSYLVNDVYRPYINQAASEHHYVWVSRISMVVMATAGTILGLQFESIISRLQFLAGIIVSYAPIMLVRWFWWRTNAWSELSAMAAAAFFSIIIDNLVPTWAGPAYYGHRVITSVILTTMVWLMVTYLTKPADMGILQTFYRRVKPLGFWKPVRTAIGVEEVRSLEWATWPELIKACAATSILIYGAIYMVGDFILGKWTRGIILLIICAVSWVYVFRCLAKMDKESPQPSDAENTN